MERAKITKENIIANAANIFNQKGFAGASLADLMEATGLKKGGIYNHFKSKNEIVFEAFDYAIKQINRAYYKVIKDLQSPLAKLEAIVHYYRAYPLNPVIEGGCPILNTSVDSDNTHPELKKRVQNALDKWITNIAVIIDEGILAGEIMGSVDSRKAAIIFIAIIEGGTVLARNFEESFYMDTITEQLLHYIKTELKK